MAFLDYEEVNPHSRIVTSQYQTLDGVRKAITADVIEKRNQRQFDEERLKRLAAPKRSPT